MSWVSCLEDIKKKFEELDELAESIRRGDISYSDPNRAKIADITRYLRIRIGNLEHTLSHLGHDDQKLVGDLEESKAQITKLMAEKGFLEGELKKVYLQNSKLREERDDERQKHEFTKNKILSEGVEEAKRYLLKLKKF